MIPYLLAVVGGYLIGQSRKMRLTKVDEFAEGGEVSTLKLKDVLKNDNYYFGKYDIREYEYDNEWSERPSYFLAYSTSPQCAEISVSSACLEYIKKSIVNIFNNGRSQDYMEGNELPHINYQEGITRANLSYGYPQQDSFEIFDISEFKKIRKIKIIKNLDGSFNYPDWLKKIRLYNLDTNKKSVVSFKEDEGLKTIQSVNEINVDNWHFKVGDQVNFWYIKNWNADAISPSPNKNELPKMSEDEKYKDTEFSKYFSHQFDVEDAELLKAFGEITSINNPKVGGENPMNWIVEIKCKKVWYMKIGLQYRNYYAPISFLMHQSLNPYNSAVKTNKE